MFARLLSLFGDHVRFPNLRAILDAPGQHASAKSAARIVGVGAAGFFPGSDWDEHGALIDQRSTCQASRLVRFRPLLPEQVSGLRLDRIKPPNGIAEQKSVLISQRDGENGRAHGADCLKRPLDASGFGVEGLHQAAGASHEEMIVEDCWLGESDDVAIKAIRPLQLEPLYLAGSEPRRIAGLKARVGGLGAPPIPLCLAVAS